MKDRQLVNVNQLTAGNLPAWEPSTQGDMSLDAATSVVQVTQLTDLSPRDKPWDRHRGESQDVRDLYLGTDYHRLGQRIDLCSDLLEFGLTTEGLLKLKNARFCRVRYCPVCQWRRSMMWRARVLRVLPQLMSAYPKSRWVFLTLTVKNCEIVNLKETIKHMNKSFQRMLQRKVWPGLGHVKSLEITEGRDSTDDSLMAHPHFHVLIMVPPIYFTGPKYLSQIAWCDLWQSCAKLDYSPQVHVSAIKGDAWEKVPEVLKYEVKSSDLSRNQAWLLELTKQTHKTRRTEVGGVLREYLKALEDEPDDLIGEEGDEPLQDATSFYFAWERLKRRYILENS